MERSIVPGLVLTLVCSAALVTRAQAPAATTNPQQAVTGDRDTPLRPLAGADNAGVSNAVLRDQSDVRAIRVVVDAGGTRAVHAHTDVKFHLFIPITGAMQVTLEGAPGVAVSPWHPYYMKTGTRHGFQNPGPAPVEIMEIFVK